MMLNIHAAYLLGGQGKMKTNRQARGGSTRMVAICSPAPSKPAIPAISDRIDLVAKLRGARERKRKETGKNVGGRKSHAELWPEVGAEARRLRRSRGKAGRLKLPRDQCQVERRRVRERAFSCS